MTKALCEWCSNKEYYISILNKEGKEELLCNDCYIQFKKINSEQMPVNDL